MVNHLLYLYLDIPRELVDYAVDPPEGAIGSNWLLGGEYATAEEAAAEGRRFVDGHREDGYARGHWTAPTF